MIEEIYQNFRQELGITNVKDYLVDSGKVTLFDDNKKALVYCEGRYPLVGYENKDVNQPGKVLRGKMKVNNIFEYKTGDEFNFVAGENFYLEGNCVCLIELEVPWRS